MSSNIFQLETFARSGYMVRLAYVDITEDLIAGILLGQIVYWYMPNEQGKSKLRVKKNGDFWLAKSREDWKEEIRITPKQYDRAIKILISKGLVEVQKFKFNGAPTNHIKLNISEVTQRVKSILTFGENPNPPLGEMELTERVNSLTEITTETTTEITTLKDNMPSDQKERSKDCIPYEDIVSYLNEQAGKSFKHKSAKTRSLIKARFKDGFTIDDFKRVIDIKTAQWLNDYHMSPYLRPETLFGTKFESYLNEKGAGSNASSGNVGGKDSSFINKYDFTKGRK
ncbi:conserved phage C-terminal domain-containing protein [Bacillus cereus]|uniref:conserved phage C-terminal domain-containing protein n=1 Tax=Bacillus cereus group sp. BfR-BA-01317 TaxID=2920294 RepID=UPI0012989123|nr:conserved phage C-terminal domain-containing protein [Bacillus cereus group sp. BfR-BA-01317]MEB9422721.1 conserved phage C-terminal domain-containing protein [Bacillus cereus]MRC06210.1 replication protein [Bacillus thuringiensis]MEB9508456.1 conserved phage C-terminal domain-containing protein [Bacillus cereus]MEB9561820.1 conserved phage C-terminal domain-containing protein [Bacillus cereus]MEC2466868.1 conserved phage C-terminal domain-containing protein [Bacillus cereus]